MDKLWEHIEHLAPGLVLSLLGVLVLLGQGSLVPGITVSELVTKGSGSSAAVLGGFFVALGYLIGVINAAFARFVFTEVIPVMDFLRWRFFCRLLESNSSLRGAVASAAGQKDLEGIKEFIAQGSSGIYTPNARWKRKRQVFHAILGRAQALGGKMAEEVAHRRREARLMRAALLPISLWAWYLYRIVPALWPYSVVGIGVAVTAYFYRENSIGDTLEIYSEALRLNVPLKEP